MVDHMNQDHRESLQRIGSRAVGPSFDDPQLVAFDGEGCYIRHARGIHYQSFSKFCSSPSELRAEMIRLSTENPQ